MATQRGWRGRRRVILSVTAAATVAVVTSAGLAYAGDDDGAADFTLTILHNNDGESKLVNAPGQPDYGGVARFKTLLDGLRTAALTGAPPPVA